MKSCDTKKRRRQKFVVGGVIKVFDNPKTTLVVESVLNCNKNLESVYLCKSLFFLWATYSLSGLSYLGSDWSK